MSPVDDSNADLCGFINIDKPNGLTSRDIVTRVQRIVGKKFKAGHAGTLDPMATGVLLVALGRATRLIPIVHEYSKTYDAGFTLGETSDTDDATGVIVKQEASAVPDIDQVRDALQPFRGTILQTPPAFSAVKIHGRRAYKAARKGEHVEIKPRPVTVHSIELLEYEFPNLSLRITCGSGTYIRSIARDLGQNLNLGGLMNRLVRTSIGPFAVAESVQVDDLNETSLAKNIQPVEVLFQDQPKHILKPEEIERLRHGKRLTLADSPKTLVATTEDHRFAARLQRENEASSQYKAIINWVPFWFQDNP